MFVFVISKCVIKSWLGQDGTPNKNTIPAAKDNTLLTHEDNTCANGIYPYRARQAQVSTVFHILACMYVYYLYSVAYLVCV